MTDPSTLPPEALAAMAERAEAATDGPWQVEIVPQVLNELGRAEVPDSIFEGGRSIHTAWNHGQLHGPAPVVTIASTPFAEPNRIVYISPEDAAFIASARSDVPALLNHIAWQAEQLAEAEELWQAAVSAGGGAAGLYNQVRSQLARERADHAATVAERDKLKVFGSAAVSTGGKLNADLATEKAARLVAEGQVAELRIALEKVSARTGGGCYDCMISEGEVCERCREIRATVEIALAATPSHGAAAVLAAAGRLADLRRVMIAQADTPEWAMMEPERVWAEFVKAVAAWRAARGEGVKGD